MSTGMRHVAYVEWTVIASTGLPAPLGRPPDKMVEVKTGKSRADVVYDAYNWAFTNLSSETHYSIHYLGVTYVGS
jgi:hypothetical protein